jgi:hypothetical protein
MSLARITECLEYILEAERDDFEENPSYNHVYYKALAELTSEVHADHTLDITIRLLLQMGDNCNE